MHLKMSTATRLLNTRQPNKQPWTDLLIKCIVESHNSGQVGCPEIVPYCGVFPYFASSLFTNGHFGHSGFVPYFASPYCERLLHFVLSNCMYYILKILKAY